MPAKHAFINWSGGKDAVFIDIFLEDLRKYREEQLKRLSMEAVFPLWKKDTGDIIERTYPLPKDEKATWDDRFYFCDLLPC